MYIKVKRILGFVASIVIMLLFAIPMFVIAICIKLDSKGPIIYKQKRIGKMENYLIYINLEQCIQKKKETENI